jgi:hypothetical protein
MLGSDRLNSTRLGQSKLFFLKEKWLIKLWHDDCLHWGGGQLQALTYR